MSRTPPRLATAPLSAESALAADIRALVASGARAAARERFAELVVLQQRLALRIAYQYLRDMHDADAARARCSNRAEVPLVSATRSILEFYEPCLR
jgi:hypothetical protein